MTTEVIGLPYETHRARIGLKGQKTFDPTKLLHPDAFIRTEDARDLRKGRVKKLTGVLENRKNFSGVWLVNKKGSKARNIDCNHRYDALVTFLVYNPDVEVEVELHVYENLSEDEERVEFTNANNSAGQTTSDYLQQYKKTLNIWGHINKEYDAGNFPIKVSHKNNGNQKIIALHTLFHPYLTRDDIPYRGAFDGAAVDFIEELQQWNGGGKSLNTEGSLAYNTMKAFLKDFISVFGEFTAKSMYWRACNFFAIFRIWYDNKSQLNQEEMQTRLKKLTRGSGLDKIRYWHKKGAPRGNVETAIIEFLLELNGARQSKRMYVRHFLKDKGEVKRFGWGDFLPMSS